MIDFSAWPQGFFLGLGLFVCPGPKDVLILRASLAGRSPLLLIGIGAGSDVLLVALGILGLSAAFQSMPAMRTAATMLGIALLLLHGLLAARSALRRDKAASTDTAPAQGAHGIGQLLAVSLFNPATWLDTVLVIGAIGVGLAQQQRFAYALGAMCASLAWFTVWVLAARGARGSMGSPANWRRLDAGVALAMFGMAAWLFQDM